MGSGPPRRPPPGPPLLLVLRHPLPLYQTRRPPLLLSLHVHPSHPRLTLPLLPVLIPLHPTPG